MDYFFCFPHRFGGCCRDPSLKGGSEAPKLVWDAVYGGTGNDGWYSVIQTSEGGYALAGYTSSYNAVKDDFWLPRLSSIGVMEWNRTYGGIGFDDTYSVIQTSDGGFAMAGFTNSSGAGSYDGWIVKVNSVGVTQWNRTYGGPNADDLYSVVQTSDGGYAMVGYTTSFGFGGADFWLVKVDSAGNTQWNRTYGGTDADDASSLIKTSDGGYAVVGWTRSFGAGGTDCWLIKVDSSGVLQWEMTYGGAGNDGARSVVQTNDGGYALAGYTASSGAGASDYWLIKTDSSGTIQWTKTFGGTGSEGANSIVKTSDGGFAIAGSTNSFGSGNEDFWLVKVDSVGVMEWSQTYGQADDDNAFSVIQTSDGGYVVAGRTAYFLGPPAFYNNSYVIGLSTSPSPSPSPTSTPVSTSTPIPATQASPTPSYTPSPTPSALSPAPSPSSSSSSTTSPSSSPIPLSMPIDAMLLVAAVSASVTVIGAGLVFYLRKRKR